MLFKNKKSQDSIAGTIVFIIVAAVFFGILLLFISQIGTGAGTLEKIYSREIAVAIDSMRPGTEITFYLPDLFDKAKANNFNGNIIFPNYENGTITIRAVEGAGNSYSYYTKLEPGSVSFNREKKIITINSGVL